MASILPASFQSFTVMFLSTLFYCASVQRTSSFVFSNGCGKSATI